MPTRGTSNLSYDMTPGDIKGQKVGGETLTQQLLVSGRDQKVVGLNPMTAVIHGWAQPLTQNSI